VRDAITSAGATNGGTITLTSKWSLREVEQRDQLRQAFGDRVLGERDPGTDAAKLLGELLLDPAEETVVTNLAEAGFIETAPAEDARQFPPSSAEIVVFASKNDARLAELARGAAGVTPTLVVAPSVEELGAVGVLRRIQDPSQQLSTFDSAGDDSAGVGVVLALRAAVDGHGGDFGRGPGLKFLPPT
jgi:hypothetical protein